MTYALSDSRDSSFRQRCQHVHEEHCSECDSMNSVLNETIEFVEQDSFPSKDDSDEAQYLAQHSRDTILAWKAHQLCTVMQDKARLEILENLDYGSVFLTQDWAMKFLPRKYRESQSTGTAKGEFPGTYPLTSTATTTSWSLRDLCILSRIAPKEVQLSLQLWHTF